MLYTFNILPSGSRKADQFPNLVSTQRERASATTWSARLILKKNAGNYKGIVHGDYC